MSMQVEADTSTVEVNGLRLNYLDWGNSSAPPMLLLHATASHAHLWDHFARRFRHAFHVVAFDSRGNGDSEWPADYQTGYAQDNWVSDIKGFLDAVGLKPVTLIGVSTGANNAMHFAAAHPDYVSRLVMIEMAPEVQREGVSRVISSIPAQETFDSLEEAVAYLAGSAGRADPVLARDHALHSIRPLGDGRYGMKGDPNLRRRDWRRPLHTSQENWAAAHAVSCPTLLVRGGDSRLVAAGMAERMRDEMQNADLITIEGAGHMVPLHKPQELEVAAAEWLGVTLGD